MSLKDGLKAIHKEAKLDTEGQVEQMYGLIEVVKEEYQGDKSWAILSFILLVPILLVVGFGALLKEIGSVLRYVAMVVMIIYGGLLGTIRDSILRLFKKRKA
ncbi:hypothetical protein [Cronobacter phage vB_Cdu_VP8]|nr:hypothetical protein [Cronobacter phage vB_Cdu_VP8]